MADQTTSTTSPSSAGPPGGGGAESCYDSQAMLKKTRIGFRGQVGLRYLLALAVTALGVLLRWAVPGVLAGTPYLAFYPAVVAAAAFGGLGPGLLTTLGSALCAEVLFGVPPGTIHLANPVVLERIAMFLAGGTGVSLIALGWRLALKRELQRGRQLRQANERLRTSEQRYRGLFESMDEGFALCQMVYDPTGKPVDWRYLEVNPAFEKLTGLTAANVVGRLVSQVIPGIESHWIENYACIVASGHGERFANPVSTLGRQYEVYAYRPVPGHFAAIFTDITQRKAEADSLFAAKLSAERAMSAAEDATKAKDHFLAVLSHELRTPLAPVLAGVPIVQKELGPQHAMAEILEIIRRNVELEARLIDDLLDVTRITRGKIELNRQPIELGTVIRRAVEVCQSDIEARELDFMVKSQDQPCLVNADAARLQQVFWNLIRNAVKFTPRGGCVGVRTWRDNGTAVIEISDSGVGIEPEVLPRIFNAFEQGSRSITQRFGGLGLGLTITKSLVEMHGGSIAARSDGKGKGATFRVTLPVVAPVPQVKEPSTEPPVATRALHIPLIEDHGDTARIMKRLLKANGHEVTTAGDLATALATAQQGSFDLLISDLGLPDGSGLDLMRQLVAKGKAVPAIALTGYGQDEDVALCRQAGFAAHLTKPINMDQLARTIATVTGTNGLPNAE